MIGLVIVAHHPLGRAFVEAAEHVFGQVPQIEVLDVTPEATIPIVIARAEQLVGQADSGDGVLVLTDLFGATPANIAASMADPHVKVIAGLNLPMLLRAICYRHDPLAEMAEKAAAGGALGILAVGLKMPQKQANVPDTANRDGQRSFQQQQQQP